MRTEWLSGNRSSIMSWNSTVNVQDTILQSQLDPPIPLTENIDQAVDGTLYFAMQTVSRHDIVTYGPT